MEFAPGRGSAVVASGASSACRKWRSGSSRQWAVPPTGSTSAAAARRTATAHGPHDQARASARLERRQPGRAGRRGPRHTALELASAIAGNAPLAARAARRLLRAAPDLTSPPRCSWSRSWPPSSPPPTTRRKARRRSSRSARPSSEATDPRFLTFGLTTRRPAVRGGPSGVRGTVSSGCWSRRSSRSRAARSSTRTWSGVRSARCCCGATVLATCR